MRFKNVFCTQLYKDTFSKVLKEDEFTHGDEILVDMEEPDGDRISYIIMHHGHSISDCKAFVATTDEMLWLLCLTCGESFINVIS